MTLTVLVVDDDASVRKAVKRLLASNGYQALTFESAEELLMADCVRGEVILLLDICLPGMSGLDLYARLASSGRKRPVIFMTAHDDSMLVEKAEEAGTVAFLRKPFCEDALLNALSLASGRRIETEDRSG